MKRKQLKQFFKKILVAIVFIFVAFVFIVKTMNVETAKASIISDYTLINDTINTSEQELMENNADVVSILEYQKGLYTESLANLTGEELTKTQDLINQINNEITYFTQYKTVQNELIANGNELAAIDDEIVNMGLKAAVTSVIAVYYQKQYLLSAELLSHMLINPDRHTYYTPVNWGALEYVDLISKEIPQNEEVVGIAEFEEPSFSLTLDQIKRRNNYDAYYALGNNFVYQKKYVDSTKVGVNIKEIYTYQMSTGRIDEQLCLVAETKGIIVPFILTIEDKIVAEGKLPYEYEIVDGEAHITHVGNMNYIDIPSQLLDYDYENLADWSNRPYRPVTTIAENCFAYSYVLMTITLPNTVTRICDNAFLDCVNLKEITLSTNLTYIGNEAFKNCGMLRNIDISEENYNIITLGTDVFMWCYPFMTITVPQNRYMEYLNEPSWVGSTKYLTTSSTEYSTYSIDDTSEKNISFSLDASKSKIVKLNVTAANKYEFVLNYPSILRYTFYDNKMAELFGGSSITQNANAYTFSKDLEKDVYYLGIIFNDATSSGDITITIRKKHVHDYTYAWRNYTQHHYSCDCGDSGLQPHAVSASSASTCAIGGGGNYKKCLLCGGNASIGFVGYESVNTLRSQNGSYILPNGVIVLVDIDIEAYLNGTLVFNSNEYEVVYNSNVAYYEKNDIVK